MNGLVQLGLQRQNTRGSYRSDNIPGKKETQVSLVEQMDTIKGWWKQLQEKAKKTESFGLALPAEVSTFLVQGFMVKKRMAEDK